MIVHLIVSSEADCEEQDVCDLANRLQRFFHVAVPPPRVPTPPLAASGLPLDPSSVAAYLQGPGYLPRTPTTDLHVFLSSLPVGDNDSGFFSGVGWDLAVLSNYFREGSAAATTLWFAMHVVHMGMSRLLDSPCKDLRCMCGIKPSFGYLCHKCRKALFEKFAYYDALPHLDLSILWHNEMSHQYTPSLDIPHSVKLVGRLPLAEYYSAQFSAKGQRPFEGTIIVMVLHLLSDLVPFVRALAACGAAYEDLYLVAKAYRYGCRDLVSHELEALGVHVVRASASTKVSAAAGTVLERLLARTDLSTKRIVVIEDGGYFTPLLHEPAFSTARERCVGAVEQTTKGITRDRKIAELGFPILSVAGSAFKGQYESPEIGRVAVQNLARFLRDVQLSGENAVVFGFGSIGTHVACHLNKSLNMAVSVVEPDVYARQRACYRKDAVVEAEASFKDLTFHEKAVLVVGASGAPTGPSITEDVILAMRDGCVLASTSSDQDEIDLDALARLAQGRQRDLGNGRTEYILKGDAGERRIILLAEGFPVNFYGSESLPNDSIDPVMSLLMLCAAELCMDPGQPHEILPEMADRIVRKHKLVEQFLDRRYK